MILFNPLFVIITFVVLFGIAFLLKLSDKNEAVAKSLAGFKDAATFDKILVSGFKKIPVFKGFLGFVGLLTIFNFAAYWFIFSSNIGTLYNVNRLLLSLSKSLSVALIVPNSSGDIIFNIKSSLFSVIPDLNYSVINFSINSSVVILFFLVLVVFYPIFGSLVKKRKIMRFCRNRAFILKLFRWSFFALLASLLLVLLKLGFRNISPVIVVSIGFFIGIISLVMGIALFSFVQGFFLHMVKDVIKAEVVSYKIHLKKAFFSLKRLFKMNLYILIPFIVASVALAANQLDSFLFLNTGFVFNRIHEFAIYLSYFTIIVFLGLPVFVVFHNLSFKEAFLRYKKFLLQNLRRYCTLILSFAAIFFVLIAGYFFISKQLISNDLLLSIVRLFYGLFKVVTSVVFIYILTKFIYDYDKSPEK